MQSFPSAGRPACQSGPSQAQSSQSSQPSLIHHRPPPAPKLLSFNRSLATTHPHLHHLELRHPLYTLRYLRPDLQTSSSPRQSTHPCRLRTCTLSKPDFAHPPTRQPASLPTCTSGSRNPRPNPIGGPPREPHLSPNKQPLRKTTPAPSIWLLEDPPAPAEWATDSRSSSWCCLVCSPNRNGGGRSLLCSRGVRVHVHVG